MKSNGYRQDGFALLGVLWIIVGLSVLALTIGRVSRHAVTMAEMTHDQIAGRWFSEGCLARFRSVADAILGQDPKQAGSIWRDLDRHLLVDSAEVLTGCDMTMHPLGRVVINRASIAELEGLPGMTPEAVAKVTQMQQIGEPITDLLQIESGLSPAARAIFDVNYAALLHHTTVEPDLWSVRAQTHFGAPPTPSNIEVHLARAGSRVAIVQWVEW